jgi:hypothetical protein
MLADLDNIICDFMDQLRTATEDGWYRTRPDHYRAILAALESALRERQGRHTAHAVMSHGPGRDVVSVASCWSWKPLLSLIPVSRSSD